MDFSPALSGRAKNHPSSRRTLSFSSSSSFSSCSSLGSSYYLDDSPMSPAAPATPLPFPGVPFSWEQLPGIPKNLQNHKKKESINLVPLLPPPATVKKYNSEDPTSRKKFSSEEGFRKDPFITALVKCSKEDDNQESGNLWTGAKISRSISDRFGFINLYTSCKRSCVVSESIVYFPKSRKAAPSYFNGLINHRSL